MRPPAATEVTGQPVQDLDGDWDEDDDGLPWDDEEEDCEKDPYDKDTYQDTLREACSRILVVAVLLYACRALRAAKHIT